MNKWGTMMHDASGSLLEMVAIGLGLHRDVFTTFAQNGTMAITNNIYSFTYI